MMEDMSNKGIPPHLASSVDSPHSLDNDNQIISTMSPTSTQSEDGAHISENAPQNDINKDTSQAQPFITPATPCEQKTGLLNSSRHQKLVFLLLLLRELSGYTAAGAMPNLFPPEAAIRGVSPTLTGWIFGIFPFVQFIASPLAGKLISLFGPKKMLIIGNLIFGLANVLFGCVDFLPHDGTSRLVFIILCFVLRITEALGNAAAITSVYAISTFSFPDNPATVLGILECSVGLGTMIGPVLGALLFEAGGFCVPFIVLGGLCLLLIPAFVLVIDTQVIESSSDTSRQVSLFSLVRIPTVALMAAAVMLSGGLWGALEPTLEPHLVQYNLNVVKVSLVFLLSSGMYTLSAPVVGVIADKITDCNVIIILGFIMLTVAHIFLGPSSLLHMDSNLNMDLVSLSVISLGWSLTNVPNMAKMIQAAEHRGIASSISLHGTVAGLFNGMYFLGEAIGPVFASWITDVQSFGWTMTYLSAICLFMFMPLTPEQLV